MEQDTIYYLMVNIFLSFLIFTYFVLQLQINNYHIF